jgi:hypothetical protein
MTAQQLKEELMQREAYALGYKNGSTDVIMAMAKRMEEEQKNLESKKEVLNNGNSDTSNHS